LSLRVALGGNCGLNQYALAYLYIDHTLQDCREDPNAIEQNFTIAQKDIEAGLANGTYAPDQRLDALVTVLERGALDLRANHPDVAQAWEVRAKQALRELDAEKREAIATGAVEIAKSGLLAGPLASETNLDGSAVATGNAEVAGPALKRLAFRLGRIRALSRAGEVIRKIDGSAAYKGARILAFITMVLGAIIALL
jgi:hypothetical protein